MQWPALWSLKQIEFVKYDWKLPWKLITAWKLGICFWTSLYNEMVQDNDKSAEVTTL